MLVVKSFGAGAIAGVVAVVLYLVVVVLMPVMVGSFESSSSGGGGMVGFSFSIELGILVGVIGFVLGFGWTLFRGWSGQ